MLLSIPNSPGTGQIPLARIARELDVESSATLSNLCHVLAPPLDAPHTEAVLKACFEMVSCFRESLSNPSPELTRIEKDLSHLAATIVRVFNQMLINRSLDVPLYRRLSRYPTWGLFLVLSNCELPLYVRQAVGAELALSMNERKRFSTGFAGALRRAIDPKYAVKGGVANIFEDKLLRSIQAVYQRARRVFSDIGETPEDESCGPKDLLAQHLRRRLLLGTIRHKQGVLTWQNQSVNQMLQSGAALRKSAEGGDHNALAVIVAFLAGVPTELALTIPIDSELTSEFTIQLNLEDGTVITHLHHIFPDAARPSAEAAPNYHDSQQVIMKPLPQFVFSLLQEARSERPTACTLGELLFVSNASGRQVTYQEEGKHQPSVKRFLESAAPFMVTIGLNRLVAAALSNDFHVVPVAKFYYATIDRDEIWSASDKVFDRLRWGAPTPFLEGPSAGSQVTPTRAAVKAWFRWMAEKLDYLPHGRSMSLELLLEFHNCYAHIVASLLVFDFAARVTKELKFTAIMFESGSKYLCLADKQAGANRGAHPVPISAFSGEQVRRWVAHCTSFKSRLEKHGMSIDSPLQIRIADVLSGRDVPLIFTADERRPSNMGSRDLTNWWPPQLQFPGNVGRHFWQRALKERGVPESFIDSFVRHESGGVELFSSTSVSPPMEWIEVVARERDAVLVELGFVPVTGLSRRLV